MGVVEGRKKDKEMKGRAEEGREDREVEMEGMAV